MPLQGDCYAPVAARRPAVPRGRSTRRSRARRAPRPAAAPRTARRAPCGGSVPPRRSTRVPGGTVRSGNGGYRPEVHADGHDERRLDAHLAAEPVRPVLRGREHARAQSKRERVLQPEGCVGVGVPPVTRGHDCALARPGRHRRGRRGVRVDHGGNGPVEVLAQAICRVRQGIQGAAEEVGQPDERDSDGRRLIEQSRGRSATRRPRPDSRPLSPRARVGAARPRGPRRSVRLRGEDGE